MFDHAVDVLVGHLTRWHAVKPQKAIQQKDGAIDDPDYYKIGQRVSDYRKKYWQKRLGDATIAKLSAVPGFSWGKRRCNGRLVTMHDE